MNVWAKVPSQVEPFKKHQLDYGRHELTGGNGAVSDRLSSESSPAPSFHLIDTWRGLLEGFQAYTCTHSPAGMDTSVPLNLVGGMVSQLPSFPEQQERVNSARVKGQRPGWGELVSFCAVIRVPEALQKCHMGTDAR